MKENGYYVEGGSRSNGFDITDLSTAEHIADNFDILINNAYYGNGQLELLRRVYDKWKNTTKTIINVGSWNINNLVGRPLENLNYNVHKKALETYSFWICANDSICKSMMYNPGFIDTPLMKQGMSGWSQEDIEKYMNIAMEPIECAKTIKFMIENNYKFKEITHHS